jgi:transcriptional regulator with XRE-family HTH domain
MSDAPSSSTPGAAARLAGEIKRLRTTADLSQSTLGTRIGYTKQYISLAERSNGGIPSRELVTAIGKALEAEQELLALWRDARAERLRLHGDPVAAAGPADDPIPTQRVELSERTVHSYTAVTRLLASQRQTMEPEALLNLVSAHRAAVASLFRRTTSDGLKDRLGELLGETSIVASRVWSALGDRTMALANCAFARKLGHELDNPALGAMARLFESNLRSDAATLIGSDGDIVEGLRLLVEASCVEELLSPPARARLAAEQAQAYAILGLEPECRNALDRADRAVEHIIETDRVGLFSDWNPSRLLVYQGTCWLSLDKPAKARPLLTEAIRVTVDNNRNVALAAEVDLAGAHVAMGDLDEGCRLLGDALATMTAIGNARGIERARRARARMRAIQHERPVRQLDDRIMSLGIR